MARRKKKAVIAEHPAHDDEGLIARLQDEHPEVLTAEVDFDLHIGRILKAGAVPKHEIPARSKKGAKPPQRRGQSTRG